MQLRICSVITALLAATSLVRSIPTKRASSGMFGNSKFVPPPAVSGPRWNATAHSPVSQGVQASAMTAPFWVVYNDQWVSGENGPPITTAINVSFCVNLLDRTILSSEYIGLQRLVSQIFPV
jgi:hypothetical protein